MNILRINYERLSEDVIQVIAESATEAIRHFLSDATNGMKANDQEIQETIIDMAKNRVTSACIFYAQSILESFGRGRQMDKTSEYLTDYINSELWNPAREKKPGAPIVGRPKGNYTNILGQTVYSTGEKEGQVTSINVGKVVHPTYAIQNAEKKLNAALKSNGYVYRILNQNVNSFLEEVRANPSKYFYNEEVSQ